MYNSPIALLKGIRTEFSKQLAAMPQAMFKPFVQNITSDSNKEEYRFLDAMPYIKEWKDKRTTQDFKDYLFSIVNKHWEITIDVDRDTLSDSKKSLGGNLEKDIRGAAIAWNNFQDKLVYDLLIANGSTYDGSAMFATSHNIDGTVAIDNLKTGSGTTYAQIETDYATASTAMYGYVDKNMTPLNSNPKFIVLCPSQLYTKFKTLRNSQQVYDGSGNKTNIYQNDFDIIVNTWQSTSDNDWYLINTNAQVLPFILQERQSIKWDVKDDPEYLYIKYMTDARMNAGYGAFTSILKVNN